MEIELRGCSLIKEFRFMTRAEKLIIMMSVLMFVIILTLFMVFSSINFSDSVIYTLSILASFLFVILTADTLWQR
jgi:hypothetical protein